MKILVARGSSNKIAMDSGTKVVEKPGFSASKKI